jgi:hypothetical protein
MARSSIVAMLCKCGEWNAGRIADQKNTILYVQ